MAESRLRRGLGLGRERKLELGPGLALAGRARLTCALLQVQLFEEDAIALLGVFEDLLIGEDLVIGV